MYLLETDVLAIMIALLGASFVMVVSIRAYGKLMRENQELRKELTELSYEIVRGGK